MGEVTKIEWTANRISAGTNLRNGKATQSDVVIQGGTFNLWHGCTKVSPACARCYAETLGNRFGVQWGKDAPRKFFGAKHWGMLPKMNAKARAAGVQIMVFCCSMADIADETGYVDPTTGQSCDGERAKFWDMVEQCPDLIFLLLTKRPQNLRAMLPDRWKDDHGHGRVPANVWLMVTVESQPYVERIHQIMEIDAPVYGVSMEPLFGMVDLPRQFLDLGPRGWIITGGESAARDLCRPGHPDWYRHLRDQAQAHDVPYFYKQWGSIGIRPYAGEPDGYFATAGGQIVPVDQVEWRSMDQATIDEITVHSTYMAWDHDKHTHGRTLDGVIHNGQPSPAYVESIYSSYRPVLFEASHGQ